MLNSLLSGRGATSSVLLPRYSPPDAPFPTLDFCLRSWATLPALTLYLQATIIYSRMPYQGQCYGINSRTPHLGRRVRSKYSP